MKSNKGGFYKWRKRTSTLTFEVLPSSLLKIKRRHKIKMRPKPKAQGQALKYSCIVLGGVVIK